MVLDDALLDEILPCVEKPSRYLGSEWNSVHKDWKTISVRMAFAFPDLYEVGMSHLGLQILYGLVNDHPGWLMERVFAPGTDLERELRARRLPLFTLESHRSLADFDLIGFTLQSELTFTNLLNILDLGGIPLLTSERSSGPLVIAGGPVAYNPEPLAGFCDAFVIGEGEEVLPELLTLVQRLKEERKWSDRDYLLRSLAMVPGVYVPSLYRVTYHRDGRVAGITPLESGVPKQVTKRLITDLDQAYYPPAPVIPLAEAVHERGMLELFRGCTRGCRFCQAGMIYRPVRERHPQCLLRQGKEIINRTGYEELSLVSLSSLDYSSLRHLLPQLGEECGRTQTGMSLPSLRVDSFSVGIAGQLPGHRSSLTFAPEAGTQRLRDVINKGVTSEDLLEAARAALKGGWSALKLYFMVGLPTETETDLDGIASLVEEVRRVAREVKGKRQKVRLTISASSFVPKAHSPFQWEGQLPREQLMARHRYLRDKVEQQGAVYHWHDVEASFLEAVMARGDRRLGPVILEAWRRGCKFDGWSEQFRFDLWLESFATAGLDPRWYAERKIAYEEVLPWQVISTGIGRDFLIEEHRKALRREVTPDCRLDDCGGCGACGRLGVATDLAGDSPCGHS